MLAMTATRINSQRFNFLRRLHSRSLQTRTMTLDDHSIYRATQGPRHLQTTTKAHYQIGATMSETERARETGS
jgi:hypothetical protein